MWYRKIHIKYSYKSISGIRYPTYRAFCIKNESNSKYIKKLGFKIIKDVFTDSGEGLIEDDYLMQLDV